jgi:lipoyl(octanoyl) transferase
MLQLFSSFVKYLFETFTFRLIYQASLMYLSLYSKNEEVCLMFRKFYDTWIQQPQLNTFVWVLPCLAFETVYDLQKKIVQEKIAHPTLPDVLLITSHPPCYTLGRASSIEERATRFAFPSHEIERGGHLTFHHPQQVIVYPILKLKKKDVRAHLTRVLRWGQKALADLGVACSLDGQGSGLWLDESHKVASVGLAIRRWVSFHGLAINVSVEECMWQTLPEGIYPCALAQSIPTNLCDVKPELTCDELIDALIRVFQQDDALGTVGLFYEGV